MKRVLLINPFGIGDVLFTTPVIHALKKQYPSLRVGYLCNTRSSVLLKNNPYVDKIFIYDRDEFEEERKKSFISWLAKNIRFVHAIKAEHFDTALDFSLNAQFGFFAWAAGIPSRIGYDFKRRGRFLTTKIALEGYDTKHMVAYYAQLLDLIGAHSEIGRLELFPAESDLINIERRLEANGVHSQDLLVGIVPAGGRSWGKNAYLKHWEVEKFARLADIIVANYKAKIIIMGDFSEKGIAHKMTEAMSQRALDFTGTTTVGESIALLSKLRLVIANDGGPLHMAKALKIKTVSIFGPVDEKVYGPYPKEDGDAVIRKQMPCQPCYKHFRFTGCAHERACILGITVEEVFAAVEKLLSW